MFCPSLNISKIFIVFISVNICFLNFLNYANANEDSYSDEVTLNDEDSLIVEVYIGRYNTTNNIEIYQNNGGGYFVPIGILSQILDFAIEVDGSKATGWFINEDRLVEIDASGGKFTLQTRKGKRQDNFPKSLIVEKYDDLYIDSSLFSKIFPIDIEVNYSDLVMRLITREKIAIESGLEREKLRQRNKNKKQQEKNFPLVKKPYKIYEHPFTDIDIDYDYNKDSDDNHNNRVAYSVLSQGDLGYLTSQLSAIGNSEDSLTSLRLNMGRKSYYGGLLGVLDAKSFSFGDITSTPVALTTSRDRGRGFTISNTNLNRADQFDSTSFIGDSTAGWEVEIYQNGVLLDYQIVESDGKYEFNDIPIFYGDNVFRIVSYGPQGQVREKIENILIDNSILSEGEFNYNVSLDQKSRSIFGIDEDYRIDDNDISNGALRMVANLDYGLNDRTTFNSSIVRTKLDDDKIHNYYLAGVKNSFSGFFTNTNVIYDVENDGIATQFLANTRLMGVNLRGEYSIFNNFISEVENSPTGYVTSAQERQSLTKLDIDGRLFKPLHLKSSGLSYRFSGELEKFKQNESSVNLSNRLSTSFYQMGLTNNLNYSKYKTSLDAQEYIDGNFSIRSHYKKFSLRLSSDYEIKPDHNIEAISLRAQRQINHNSNIRFSLTKDLGEYDATNLEASLNKRFDQFTLSTNIGIDDKGNASLGTSLSISLGHEPRANRWKTQPVNMASEGAVSARAFLDSNYNEIYDDGEYIIPQATFIAKGKKYKSNEDNLAFITKLNTDEPNNILIDTTSLENPFWIPKTEGYKVATREGSVVHLDFPISNTTEIDGTIYLTKSDTDTSTRLARINLELIDTKGNIIAKTKSQFDGFYIFEKIIPGEYFIQVAEQNLKKLDIKKQEKTYVNVKNTDDIVGGMDIFMIK